jgi:hypothetical protein
MIMTRLLKQILSATKQTPITSTEIRKMFHFKEVNGNPQERALITELIMDWGVPIGATSDGYFLIRTEEELEEYLAILDSRALNIMKRKEKVELNYDSWDGETSFTPPQRKLDISPPPRSPPILLSTI